MLIAASSSAVGYGRRGTAQVALWIDLPAAGDLEQLLAQLPAVCGGLAGVVGAGALQRHAAAVLADRGDRLDLLGGERGGRRDGGELGALALDRLRVDAALLDQRRSHAPDTRVGEVPRARELQHGEAVAGRVGTHQLELVVALLDPSGGTKRTVVVAREGVT